MGGRGWESRTELRTRFTCCLVQCRLQPRVSAHVNIYTGERIQQSFEVVWVDRSSWATSIRRGANETVVDGR